MAVSGVRNTEQERLPAWEGLLFWGLQYRRLSLTVLVRGVWLFALWAGLSAVLFAPVLAQVKGGAGLYLLLGWVVALHLFSRGWLERRLPDPSFAQDVRTGNFDQLRLMPLTAHGLLLQRSVPDLMFRVVVQSVWLPLYVLLAQALGTTLLDACVLWLLFSFGNYIVLGLVSIALLTPVEWSEWGLGWGLLAYAFLVDGGRVRTAVAQSSLFVVLIALPIAGRALVPTAMTAPLPNLLSLTLLWLLVEALRFERMARWVNAPSGFGRGMYLLPSAGLIFYAAWASRDTFEQMGLMGGALTQIQAVSAFCIAGYLSVLLLTLQRQAEMTVQPLRAHLLETGLLRVLSLLLIGGMILGGGLPMGAGAFWGVLAWLGFVEWLGGALTRWQLQQAHSRARAWAYLALLLGALPALVFWMAPMHFAIGALSPSTALILASEGWAITRIGAQPPVWACAVLPVVRYALVLGALALIARTARTTQPPKRYYAAWELLALPLAYPLTDWWIRGKAVNPMLRLTIAERHPPFAPIVGVAMFLLSYLSNRNSAGALIPLGLFLWLWGYYMTAKRVRRWLDSGELSSAFLAGLTPQQVFWGWVFGTWYRQQRVLIAAFLGALWGWGLAVLLGNWWAAGVAANPIAFILFGLGFSAGFYFVFLALWSCAWLMAAPIAIRDQLSQQSVRAPVLTPRAAILAGVYSLVGCCAPLAPFLLIGLPIYASQSTTALARFARASGELSRRYGKT